MVLALEVDRVDCSGCLELCDQLAGPVGRRVELEAQGGVEVEPRAEALGRSGLAESHRDDERQRLRRPADCLSERLPGLTECQVECRTLECPAPVVEVGVLLRLVIEERQRREVVRERGERPGSVERQVRPSALEQIVLGGVVGDVLPEPLLAGAGEADHGRLAQEATRDLELEAAEGVALDQ